MRRCLLRDQGLNLADDATVEIRRAFLKRAYPLDAQPTVGARSKFRDRNRLENLPKEKKAFHLRCRLASDCQKEAFRSKQADRTKPQVLKGLQK